MRGIIEAMNDRLERARLALDGLSVGDALGQSIFRSEGSAAEIVGKRVVPPSTWRWSDDTLMAHGLLDELATRGQVDRDALALRFARDFVANQDRGYGNVAYVLLTRINEGAPWRDVVSTPFRGTGSMGNGAAMRIAPLGGWFADDDVEAVRQAIASAEVTHAHPEGVAGGVAIAVAAVFAWRARVDPSSVNPADALAFVAQRTPEGETKRRIIESAKLLRESPAKVSEILGDGRDVTAPDTVPFALWCAMTSLGRYEESLWRALDGLLYPYADRDTVCAIVGGVGALASGGSGIPEAWLKARESLPPMAGR